MSHGATISRKWRLEAGPAPTGQTQLEPSLVGKARDPAREAQLLGAVKAAGSCLRPEGLTHKPGSAV